MMQAHLIGKIQKMDTLMSRAHARVSCEILFALLVAALAPASESVVASKGFSPTIAVPHNFQTYLRPVVAQPEPDHKQVIDAQFIGMSALVMGLTIADIERTQQCLGRGTCRELNPLMPRSRLGMYAVNLPINAAAMYLSYRLKASGKKTWWIAPVVVSGAHGVGVAFVF